MLCRAPLVFLFFFFNDTATTEIYTLSLHDALPIYRPDAGGGAAAGPARRRAAPGRSEEHTSELQSRLHLVCRLLLEKKKQYRNRHKVPIAHLEPNVLLTATLFS